MRTRRRHQRGVERRCRPRPLAASGSAFGEKGSRCSGSARGDRPAQHQTGRIQSLGCLQISQRPSLGKQAGERHVRGREALRIRQAGKLGQRRHRILWAVDALDASGLLRIGPVNREQAGPVEVEERIELFAADVIKAHCMPLRDMVIAEQFADDRAVLGLVQSIGIAAARAAAGKFDTQLLKHCGHIAVDVLAAVVRMKAVQFKR